MLVLKVMRFCFAKTFLPLWPLAVFLVIGCSRQNAPAPTPAVMATASTAAPDKPVVRAGFISRYNPRLMFEEYQPIMDYLSRETPYHFELKLGKTYEDAVNFLKTGQVQMASLGAVTYLEARAQFNAVPILRPLNEEGKPFYRSLLVVRAESPVQSLADLKGRTIAFASVHSTSGNLIPRYYLAMAGIHLQDLRAYKNLKHHDSVAKAVLAGEFDAGAVKDIIAYKYLDKGLRILHASDPIPSVPFVVRPDCDPALIAAVKKALLKIDPHDPETQKMLATWNAEFRHGFAEANDAEYAGIRNMLNDIPRRCGNSCHPAIKF
jgi:phosphonate transport system substrate-binding protein